MDSKTMATLLWKWFPGRDDIYGEGFRDDANPTKYRYTQRKEQLHGQKLIDHLTGERTIGVYPIRDGASKWFALDFDGTWESSWQEASEVAALLEAAGLVVYRERSRSGAGVHVWGFLDEWTPAADVIDAVKPLVGDRVSFDRMFPLQRAVQEGKSGNLICLPFQGAAYAQGNGAFLDAAQQVIPIDAWFATVVPNARAVVTRMAAEHRRAHLTDVTKTEGMPPTALRPKAPLRTGILKMISKYGCQFMHHCWKHAGDHTQVPEPMWYAALGQFTAFESGEAAAQIMSRSRLHEFGSKWKNQLGNPPVGCAYIHEHFPQHACQGCPMTAPYHVAERSLTELVTDAGVQVSKGEFDTDLERIAKRDRGEWVSGVKPGIIGLDDYVRFRPGEMTIVGAAPSMGKTGLLVHLMVSLSSQGIPVVAVEAEMERDPLHERLLAHMAEVDSKALKGERTSGPLTADEWDRLRVAASSLKRLPIYENYNATSPQQVLEIVESTVFRHGIDPLQPFVTLFDFLQFSEKALGEQEYEKVGRNAYEFKSLAKLLSQPVIVFSQVTRDTIGIEEAPDMSVFRGSGKIEIHMNVGLVLWGEYVDGPEAPRSITIVKQTDGTVGVTSEFVFRQAISKFVARSSYAVSSKPVGLLDEPVVNDKGQLTH